MAFSETYAKLAYKICGRVTEAYLLQPLKDIHTDLKKAAMRISLVEYLSMALLTTIIIAVLVIPILMILVGSLTGNFGIGFFIGLIGGMFAATGAFFFFYSYPSIKVGQRKKNIEDLLPFATLYLATIAGSGIPPVGMFKTLARFREYGEISEEAARIVEETELIGINIADALKNAASRTPSDRFKEILWGIMTTLLVGGDLKSFLHEKSVSAMQEYRRRLEQFTATMSMFIEMYITVVVVGAIFFIVLSTIMGGIGGSSTMIVGVQLAVTFLFLPVSAVGFLILMKGIAPASG